MQFQKFFRSLLVVFWVCMLSVSSSGDVLFTFYGNQIECRCGEAGREGYSAVRVEVNKDEEFAVQLGWREDVMGRYRYREASKDVWVGSLAETPHDGTDAGYIRGGVTIVVMRYEWESEAYVYDEIVTEFRITAPCIHSPHVEE